MTALHFHRSLVVRVGLELAGSRLLATANIRDR